jgi:hypothetical protein
MPASPWEQLQEQVVPRGREFLQQLRPHVKGNAREQRRAARLARGRPELGEVIATAGRSKGKGGRAFAIGMGTVEGTWCCMRGGEFAG